MSEQLRVENLSVSFAVSLGLAGLLSPGRAKRLDAVKDVSFKLDKGQTLGLVGESGSGKTTLARAILGLVPRSAGEIVFDGAPVRGVDASAFRSVRRKASMMFQDAVASLSPRLTVGSLVTEPHVIHGKSGAGSGIDRKTIARELLTLVGLPAAFAERYPHELSGGQARRVGVARALALKPSLVLADEPTAGLDVSVQGDILNLMSSLKSEMHLSYIIVTHNLAMVRHVSDRLAIMYLGQLVETGPTRDVFRRPRHPYTQVLLNAEPVPDPRRRRTDLAVRGEIPSILNRPAGCEFHTRCPYAQDRCRKEVPVLTANGDASTVRCHFPLE